MKTTFVQDSLVRSLSSRIRCHAERGNRISVKGDVATDEIATLQLADLVKILTTHIILGRLL